jgi:hypothetical protein
MSLWPDIKRSSVAFASGSVDEAQLQEHEIEAVQVGRVIPAAVPQSVIMGRKTNCAGLSTRAVWTVYGRRPIGRSRQ